MALDPGESTTISMEFFMHGAMGGVHNVLLHIPTNDPDEPDKTVSIISDWVE